MKNSRTSLNKPFYDWIKQVREADKKIEELEDKLYYYNVKLIGYNSPNFEPRLSSTKPEYKDNRYIWIEKIKKTEQVINSYVKIKSDYNLLKSMLSDKEKVVFEEYVTLKIKINNISKSHRYNVLNDISKKFDKINSKN